MKNMEFSKVLDIYFSAAVAIHKKLYYYANYNN